MMARKIRVMESLFHIVDKDSNTIPFVLNDIQRRFAAAMTGKDIIVKARQEGFSTFIEGLFLLDCLYHNNTNAVVIAHDKDSAMKLFKRVKFFINNLNGPKPKLDYDSKTEITFPKTNSTFYVGTAGARQFGRGDTITRLHCSEVGFWETGKDILAGLLQAVPRNGIIALESTGNGVGNFFHSRAEAARALRSNYKMHFYGWQAHKEYQIHNDTPLQLDEYYDDEKRQKDNDLSDAQMKWYLDKRRDMVDTHTDEEGYRLFLQEYPTEFSEAFKFSGGAFFPAVVREDITPIKTIPKYEMRFRNPIPGHKYNIGVDVGGGVGLDSSVIEIVDVTIGEQVLEWRSNMILPENLGEVVVRYAREYNKAHVIPESNNHGAVLITYLKANYSTHLIFQQERIRTKGVKRSNEFGWFTSDKAKFHLCDHGRAVLQRGVSFYSRVLEAELQTFEEKESDGESRVKKIGAQQGYHDDTVIAFMLALYGVNRFFHPKREKKFQPDDAPALMSFRHAQELAQYAAKGRKFHPGASLNRGYAISGAV